MLRLRVPGWLMATRTIFILSCLRENRNRPNASLTKGHRDLYLVTCRNILIPKCLILRGQVRMNKKWNIKKKKNKKFHLILQWNPTPLNLKAEMSTQYQVAVDSRLSEEYILVKDLDTGFPLNQQVLSTVTLADGTIGVLVNLDSQRTSSHLVYLSKAPSGTDGQSLWKRVDLASGCVVFSFSSFLRNFFFIFSCCWVVCVLT